MLFRYRSQEDERKQQPKAEGTDQRVSLTICHLSSVLCCRSSNFSPMRDPCARSSTANVVMMATLNDLHQVIRRKTKLAFRS